MDGMHIPRPVLNAPCGLSPRLALLSVTAQPLPPGTAPDTRGSAAEGYRGWEGNLHTHWLKENPFVEGEREQAWTQPVVPPAPANQP